MSQVAGQVGLVANQALALPPPDPAQLDLQQRKLRAQLFVDGVRARIAVGQRSPGLVGQQAARTGQLLDAPLAPTPPPAAVSPLQEAVDTLSARDSAPTEMEQFFRSGGQVSGFNQLDQLRRHSQTEFRERSSPAAIIRLARLKRDILDQRRSEAKDVMALGFRERSEERDVRAGIRSELSLQLSLDRAARVKRSAELQATDSLTSVLGEQLRGTGIDRKILGKVVRNLDRGGPFPQEEILRRSLVSLGFSGNVLEDQVIIMSRAIEAERRSPGLFDRLKVELSAPAKKTAAERKATQKEQRAREITRLILSTETLGGESLAAVEEEILDLAVQTISEASSIQLQLDRTNPGLAQRFETLRLRLSTFVPPPTGGRGTGVDARMDELMEGVTVPGGSP